MSEIALSTAGVPELPLSGRLLSDERLARLASRGSARAFASLYERHHQALYRYCLSIVRNPEDAQDALQSALTRAFAALQARERDLAVRPWLFRIAHNEAVSILRRRRPEDRLLDEQEPSPLTVERTVDQRERLSTLVSDLQALPLRQRAALLMRELSGLSIEEIAAVLAISPGAAKQTLFEARSSLQAFAEGRAMECEAVRSAISEGDGRRLRSRRMRAHLRGCPACSEFRALIPRRSADLHALAPPLPAAASATLLTGLLAHGAGGSHAGGVLATSAGALGSHAAGSLVVKGLAGVAILAVAGAGTAQLVSAPARHQRLPAAARAVHANQVAPANAASKPLGVPLRRAGSRGASPSLPGTASTPGGSSALQSQGPAVTEAERTGIPKGSHAGRRGALGHGHGASGNGRPTSRSVSRARKPSRPVQRAGTRQPTRPRGQTPVRPSPHGAGSRGTTREAELPAVEPGSEAYPPATTSAAPPTGSERERT
jgi:RNA polymerase sigma factor (sigma-70 family)